MRNRIINIDGSFYNPPPALENLTKTNSNTEQKY